MIGDRNNFRKYKKLSEPVYAVPKSVQQTIPVYRISQNGIFQIEPDPSGKRKTAVFDKCYRMTDVNYVGQGDALQRTFMEDFCRCLNDMNESFKILVINRNIDPEAFRREVLLNEDGNYPELAREFNKVTNRRMENIRGLRQDRYLIVTCESTDFESATTQLNDLESNIVNDFLSLGCSLVPLDAIERLQLLHSFYNVGKETEFDLTNEDLAGKRDWKDDVICTYMRETKGMVEFEDHYAATIFAAKYPPKMDDDFLHGLITKPYHMIVAMDCSPIPDGVTERMLTDSLNRVDMAIVRQNDSRLKYNSFSTEITYEVQRKRDEIISDLDEMHDNNARMFYAGYTVTVTAETKAGLDRAVAEIIDYAKGKKFLFKRYTGRQIQAMNTTLPVGYRGVKIMRSLFTQGLAAMMPFHVQELSDTGGMIYGVNQTSKQLVIANRKHANNGNGFFFGVTGYGKSMMVKYEAFQVLAATKDDIIIIDPQNEYFDLCRQWGGQVVNLSEKSGDHMNPMDIPDDIDSIENFISDKSNFISAICSRAMEPIEFGPIHRVMVDRCVQKIYDGIRADKKMNPTLSTLRDELLKQPEAEARELATVLEIFVEGSLSLFSYPTNVNVDNRLTCYGINDLGQGLRPLALLVMVENVANRIASNARIGKATWVYVDECHNVLEDPYGCAIFQKLWREVRKRGGLMTGITQNILDCLVNKETRTIISNSDMICLLNQSEFEQEAFNDVLRLSPAQMKKITGAAPGTGLLKFGDKIVAFDNTIPKDSNLYRMFNTNLHEMAALGQFKDATSNETGIK